MQEGQTSSESFTKTNINRDSLMPLPVELPFESLLHQDVCAIGSSNDFSKSRGHPVFPVKLPTKNVSLSVGDLSPNEKTSNHRHAYESVIYVIEGKGYTIVEGKEIPWKKGDALYVPPWNWHQHFALDESCRYLTATNLPLLYQLGQTVLREEHKEKENE